MLLGVYILDFKLSSTYSYAFTVEIVHLIGEALHNSVDR